MRRAFHRSTPMAFTLFAALACDETPSAGTAGPRAATASAASGPSSSATTATPVASNSAQPGVAQGSGVRSARWLKVASGYEPVAIIAFRDGKPGKVKMIDTGDSAAKLTKLWPDLSKPEGLTEKMHVAPPSGKDRGPLSSVLFKPDHKDYLSVIEVKLEERGFSVAAVRTLEDPDPGKPITKLTITKEAKPIGTLEFSSPKPKMTLAAGDKSAAMMGLESDWRYLEKRSGPLRVWYSKTNAEGDIALVSKSAKPGDPEYGNVVRIWLHLERWYDAKRQIMMKITTK